MNVFEKSKWIWLQGGEDPDTYVEFYDRFEASGKEAVIRLSCDSDYTLWINGRYVSSNQYGDFEHYKIYDSLDITPYLTQGKNDIKILVHYWGVNTSRYRVARAGLIYEVTSGDTVLAVSSEKTLSRLSPVYIHGKKVMVSGQLGFTFFYDATKEGKGDAPTPSMPVDKQCTFYPRPIAKAVLRDKIPMTSCKKIDDCHYLIDLGREVVGLPVLELSSKTEQAVTVAWGEHILDGGVRMLLGGRHFHYEYTAKIGENRFTEYMLRLGCRYIEVFAKEPIELTYAGVLPQCYETQTLPVLIEDELDRRIYDTCVNTLKLCMMEHYVDCPWREQCLYAFDSRNQMLCGYYAFEGGNAAYARANLRLMGMDRRPDRLLSICAPCGVSLAIPSFSLHFITGMREYIDHTADTTLAAELFDKMQGILEEFLDHRENGVIKKIAQKGMWNFYDWSPFMSGHLGRSEEDIPDLAVNCLFVVALNHFEAICERIGRDFPYAAEREAVREGIRREFLCENGVFTMHKGREEYSVLGNAFAVLAGAVTGAEAERICDRIVSDKTLADCALSMKVMEYEALLCTNTEKYRDHVLCELRKNYKHMLDAGADTFWETIGGADAFSKAGSLCHGWSAVPIYIFHRLGIAKYN